MTKWPTIGFLVLVMDAASALGQEKPMPKEPKVSVALSFSVAEYDPSVPCPAVMKCVVRNDTAEAIQVPVGYDGHRVQLESSWGAGAQRPIFTYPNDDPSSKKATSVVKLVRLQPSQEQVVFEFPLDEILLRGRIKDRSLVWVWPGWIPHPAPPRSPIFRRARGWDDQFDSRDLLAEAFFDVRLKIGGRTLTSKMARLKIRQSTVAVALSLSSDEFNPATPSKAVLKCVVRNGTAEAIQVPARYDGHRLKLYSTSGLVLNQIKEDDLSRLERRITDLKRKIVAADDPEVIVSLAHDLAEAVKARKEFESQRLVRMEPGQERLVFEFPLDDLLVRGQTQDGSLRWGWKRRPAPPKSPLYRRLGSREFVAEVTFTVRLKTGGQTVDSKPVRLKVKPSD